MNLRMRIAIELNEPATRAAIEELGLATADCGQGALGDEYRELLRGVLTADRWMHDFIVKTPRGRTVRVDAKYSAGDTPNHSIEMRALLAAGQADLPTFYVCSHYQPGGVFVNFIALHYQEIAVVGPSSWPCCDECRYHFTTDPDPMRTLPEHCPNRQRRGSTGSDTPFFVIKPPFRPLTASSFDCEPFWYDGWPIPDRKWDKNITLKPWKGPSRSVPISDPPDPDLFLATAATDLDFPPKRGSGRPWLKERPRCRVCHHPLDPAGDNGTGMHPTCE